MKRGQMDEMAGMLAAPPLSMESISLWIVARLCIIPRSLLFELKKIIFAENVSAQHHGFQCFTLNAFLSMRLGYITQTR